MPDAQVRRRDRVHARQRGRRRRRVEREHADVIDIKRRVLRAGSRARRSCSGDHRAIRAGARVSGRGRCEEGARARRRPRAGVSRLRAVAPAAVSPARRLAAARKRKAVGTRVAAAGAAIEGPCGDASPPRRLAHATGCGRRVAGERPCRAPELGAAAATTSPAVASAGDLASGTMVVVAVAAVARAAASRCSEPSAHRGVALLLRMRGK